MLLHLGIPGFHAAVHQAIDPALRGRPVAVAVDGSPQAALFACSLEARQRRIWSGMRAQQAKLRCRDLVVCLPDSERYHRAQEALLELLNRYSPRVAGSPGHIDCDLAGTEQLWRDRLRPGQRLDDAVDQARLIAADCLHDCQRRLHLPAAIGGGDRLLVARLAERLARRRRPPVLLLPGPAAWDELDPLPAHWLPGFDRDSHRLLRDCGLERIADLRRLDAADLIGLLGERGRQLAALLSGEGEEPVPERIDPERCITCATDAEEAHGFAPSIARQGLAQLAGELGFQLRSQRLACIRLSLALRWVDGREDQRAATLPDAVSHDDEFLHAAEKLYQRLATRRVHLSRLRLTASRFVHAYNQNVLFQLARRRLVEQVRDHVRHRFGDGLLHDGHNPAPAPRVGT